MKRAPKQAVMTKAEQYDTVIIGAGPAGMSAAITCSEYGAKTLVLDEQMSPGGQIYRGISHQQAQHKALLGPDYLKGEQLVNAFIHSSAQYQPSTRVWHLDDDRHAHFSVDGGAGIVKAKSLIISSGAMERPLPFKGWTLPGVMYAGAAQILFKSHRLVPSENTIVAGSGPLLYLLVWQYLQAGRKIKAVVDFASFNNKVSSLKYLPKALLAYPYLLKGMKYQREIKKAGIPIFTGAKRLTAIANKQNNLEVNCLDKITFEDNSGIHSLQCEHLLTHFGIIPRIQFTQLLGCEHDWDERQLCWKPNVSRWGETSKAGIYVAGDGASITGAVTAELSGKLAALHSLKEQGHIEIAERESLAMPCFKAREQDAYIRPFLEAYFKPPQEMLSHPDPETILCRCEDVTAQDLANAIDAGHENINEIKFFTRCGMGPCQGRQCGQSVAHFVANTRNEPVSAVGSYRARPPVSNLSLGELATLYPEEKE